jgi:hypothetical protein
MGVSTTRKGPIQRHDGDSRTNRLCRGTNDGTDSLVFKPRPSVKIAVTEPDIPKVPFLLRLSGIASMILTRLHDLVSFLDYIMQFLVYQLIVSL